MIDDATLVEENRWLGGGGLSQTQSGHGSQYDTKKFRINHS